MDVDTPHATVDESIVEDYESLDGLGDEAYVRDYEDIISIRWTHDGIGVLLQEQLGDWSQDQLVTIAKAIDADLP